MKVKMSTTSAGPDGSAMAGSIITVSDKEGKDLIDGKYATEVTDDEESETTPQGAGDDPVTSTENLSVKEVLALVESGKLTKEKALELENAGKKRASLISQLQ